MGVKENLEKREFIVHDAANSSEGLAVVMALIEGAKSVGWGGSMTLEETGILDELRKSQKHKLYDRSQANTPEEVEDILRDSLKCDAYLTSANALLEDGRIINIDGRGNRVAGTIFGPKKVIFVIGRNKLVRGGIDEGIERVKNVAAPPNARRINRDTPCAKAGKCCDCSHPARICRTIAVHEMGKGSRTHVVLVDEDLGY